MPCYITGSSEGDARLELHETQKVAQKVTRLLCALCRAWERGDENMPEGVSEWWEEHKAIDEKRRQEVIERRLAAEEKEKQKYLKLKKKFEKE